MVEFLIYLLLTYGIVNIAVFSSIFNGWRSFWGRVSPNFFGKLFSCPMCLSFWVGVVFSIVFQCYNTYTPSLVFNIDNYTLNLFIDGSVTSGLIWIVYVIVNFFETFKD